MIDLSERMETFVPKISYRAFREAILEIKEGGYWEVNKLIRDFEKLTDEEFFERFLKLCKKHNIDYHYFIDEETPEGKYNIVITFDKYDSLQMSYSERKKQIGAELGLSLKMSLETKVRNSIFFSKNLNG